MVLVGESSGVFVQDGVLGAFEETDVDSLLGELLFKGDQVLGGAGGEEGSGEVAKDWVEELGQGEVVK